MGVPDGFLGSCVHKELDTTQDGKEKAAKLNEV